MNNNPPLPPGRKGEQGSTLVEVLLAAVLLVFVAISVLDLYTVSLAVNMGSLARTDLTYRAEKVVEVMRIQAYLAALKPATNNAACCNLGSSSSGSTSTYTIASSGTCFNTFWGPAGYGVMEADPKFDISYEITGLGSARRVTVFVKPKTSTSYRGAGVPTKAVRYVAQLPLP